MSTDLCLVVPPFDAIGFPALGSAVLASACKARGVNTRIVYGSILLASRLGFEDYNALCNSTQREMTGERLFAPFAYGEAELATLGPPVPFDADTQILFDKVAGAIGPFVEALVRQIVASKPKIVGISTNFQQNMAAIAVARGVKARAPETCVVLGGANVSDPMGEGIAAVFPWIDHIFAGEADIAFPDFCERLVRDGVRPAERVIRCPPINDMRVVSAPDFADYFFALRHFQKRGRLPPSLPDFLTLETSRGCWWGEKNHCTFCGLNADGMGFRIKPAETALAEIRELTGKWGVQRIHFSDNILPLSYFGDVLPALASWPERPRLFFEVKANLRDEQLALMARAGIDTIQPGIESLSSHVLKLVRKGVSALQNVALLRTAQAHKITVVWNFLYGIPGETAEDYEAMFELIPKIEHLHPPSGVNRIIVDRYSPYHFDAERLGIGAIAPFPSYGSIYPKDAPLEQIAYHFWGEYTTPVLQSPALRDGLKNAVATWRTQWTGRGPQVSVIAVGPGKAVIRDTRRIAPKPLAPISPAALAALAYFERPRPRSGAHDGHDGEIEALLERHLLVAHENALLSVVTRPATARAATGAPAMAAAV